MDELEIYYACLKCNYKNEKLMPVLDIIYQMVAQYERHSILLISVNASNASIKQENVIKFIRKIFPIMERIVKDNKYDSLSKAINFIDGSCLNYEYYYEGLELIYYPEEYYIKDAEDYYKRISYICEKGTKYSKELFPFDLVDYNNKFVECDYLLGRISDYLEKYKATRIAHRIVGYAYLNKLPIDDVYKMIDYLTNNYQSIVDYVRLNSCHNSINTFKLDCYVIELIANSCKGSGKVIV